MDRHDAYHPELVSQQNQHLHTHHNNQHAFDSGNFFKINAPNGMTPVKPRRASATSSSNNQSSSSTTPICRCRVLYLGSAVPHVTKDGLQGIQEPLRDLYPDHETLLNQDSEAIGIDSWLSVWSNGILIENVDGSGRENKRFFPIESLHYCAAVRYVVIPNESNNSHHHHAYNSINPHHNQSTTFATLHAPPETLRESDSLQSNGQYSSSKTQVTDLTETGRVLKMNGVESTSGAGASASSLIHESNTASSSSKAVISGGASSSFSSHLSSPPGSSVPASSSSKIKFLPLDSPFSRNCNITLHPPLFACILRRTTGIKVLECHAFICKRDQAANALVRCCFHAYADSMHAKQMEQELLESQSNYTASVMRADRAVDTVMRTDDSRRGSRDGGGGRGTDGGSRAKINGLQANGRFSRSISDLDSVENKIEAWRQRSTEALNKEVHNDSIEVIVSNKNNRRKKRHDPQIDNDDDEEDEGDINEDAPRSRHNGRRRASSANNNDDEGDDDHDNDNYKVWSGGDQGRNSRGFPSLSASTPHLHLRQNNVRSVDESRLIHAPGHHLIHPALQVLHDGRGTLRSVRTTASSVHHPMFRPPSVSSRSMINLAPHHPDHLPLTPPHHPLGFHVIHGPPPGHPGHHGPHFPFPPPVPTTLSKKQIKSLKSSMKKLQKKNKGIPLPPPEFLMSGPPPPPPFIRGHPPPPHAIPILVRGLPTPPPPHLMHPPPGKLMHPMEEPNYPLHLRPLTPVNGIPHLHPYHHLHPDHPLSLPHSVYGTTGRGMRRESSQVMEMSQEPVSWNGRSSPSPPSKASSSRRSSTNQQKQHDSNSDEPPSDSSIFNNGIYKKKANLNERAFSYSIRQESQSRSGSVGNVNYSDNESKGGKHFNPRLGAHHPMMSSSTAGEDEDGILAQSLENLHLTNGNVREGGGSKLMMLMKQRNGKSSTSSQSSSVHSSSQQQHQQPHLLHHHPHNYMNGVGSPSGQNTIANQGNNLKTASIKRGSGSSLQYHLHNTNGMNGSASGIPSSASNGGNKATPVPPPAVMTNGGRSGKWSVRTIKRKDIKNMHKMKNISNFPVEVNCSAHQLSSSCFSFSHIFDCFLFPNFISDSTNSNNNNNLRLNCNKRRKHISSLLWGKHLRLPTARCEGSFILIRMSVFVWQRHLRHHYDRKKEKGVMNHEDSGCDSCFFCLPDSWEGGLRERERERQRNAKFNVIILWDS